MADGRVLAVGVAGDPGAIFAALSTAYTVHAEPAETMRWTWLDTADWRLHRAGLALREERRGRTRELVLDSPAAPDVVAPVSGVTWPARLDTLAPSAVRAQLAHVVGVRALLPVAEVEVRRILLRLMDDVDKTRVRVAMEQQRLVTPRRAALPLHIVVRALRGYDDDAQRCVTLLGTSMDAELTSLSPTEAALAAAGHLPGAPGGEAFEVRASDPAVRPVAHALLDHVRSVDEARAGALADLDTEFLHDLRRAIRSTRALLSAAGELLPGRSAVRVERDLDWLDSKTDPMRAADIALLGVSGAGGLDVSGLDVLEPLHAQLHRMRRNELRRMRQTLRAPRAPAAFTTWRNDLRRMLDAEIIGPSAAEAARSIADSAYQALVAADPADLARRVAALREVLAAFAGLYPPGSARPIVAELDTLDDLLHARDGIRITQAQVIAAARGADLPVDTVLAAGALLDRAARREAELDAEITTRHKTITGAKTARRIRALTT